MALGDKKNRIVALAISLGIHLGILVLFMFLISWKAPNPPLSALGGIELNFGLDDVGSEEIQPTEPVGSETPNEAVVTDENKPIEQQQESIDPNKPTETLTSSTDDNNVEVKETKPKKDEIVPAKTEVKVIDKKPNELIPASEKTNATAVSTKKGKAGNQGDDLNKVGDKGSAQGTLDAKALYGNPGTGGQGGAGAGKGFALKMSGWDWDEQPKAPKLNDNENGRVVFEIEVDEDGEITSIKTLERSLSPEAEKICKQEVLKRSLVKTYQGTAPERSKGTVAFVLRTQ
jgi:outer membrane biosynthesis protein TonB